MPRRRIVFSRRAERDIKAIGEQTRRAWGPAQARSYLLAIRAAARSLQEFPERNPLLPSRFSGMRKLRSGSHLLVYRIGDTEIEIVRILHEAMDIEEWLG